MDFIKKGTQVATIIQCGGLWFANGKFGITWKLVQAAVQKPKPAITGTCFIRLNKADKEKISSQVIVEERTDNTEVNDSDDDEPHQEQEQAPSAVEEPVVVPPPVQEAVPEKKKVTKGGKK